MTHEMVFFPRRRAGLIVHISLILVLSALSVGCFWYAFQLQAGSYFALLLVFSMALLPLIILMVYRAYALIRAEYTLERDGLRLRWGLRYEDIPLMDIMWVHPASELGYRLPLPFYPMPGAILGKRRVEGLGYVEYLASSQSDILLIATSEDIFAISPENTQEFMASFQQTMEMGSISPIPRHSARPAMFLQTIWADKISRILILAGMILSLVLFVLDSLIIPSKGTISLGFNNVGIPVAPIPSQRLMLLPVLAVLAFILDFFIGLIFYRLPENRGAAYMMWAGGLLMPILFIITSLYIL